jgi:uncharacterized protein
MAVATLIWVIAVLLVLVGIIGVIIPAMPGTLLLYGGLFMGAWAENFTYVGVGTLLILALLTVLSYILDFMAGAVGVKRFGASKRAVAGALLGSVLGLFFGLPGMLLGPFLVRWLENSRYNAVWAGPGRPESVHGWE